MLSMRCKPLWRSVFFNDTATTEIYTLSLHDALPIYITGFFAKTIAPLCPLTTLQVLLIFGGITVVYTMFGGLLGVVYADVVQFCIMITGCTVFFVLAVT